MTNWGAPNERILLASAVQWCSREAAIEFMRILKLDHLVAILLSSFAALCSQSIVYLVSSQVHVINLP